MPLWLCLQQSGHLTLTKLLELLNGAYFGTEVNLFVENVYSNCIISNSAHISKGPGENGKVYFFTKTELLITPRVTINI